MNAVLQKWGNSLALRIPRTIAAEIAVTEGHVVDLRVSKGRIVISPITKKEYKLADLIAGITARNRHVEISAGSARGTRAGNAGAFHPGSQRHRLARV